MSDKILIIGAGLGGLALAQALRKRNIPYAIYERDTDASFRLQGWAIALHWILPDLYANVPEDMPPLEETSVFNGVPKDVLEDAGPMAAFYTAETSESTFSISPDKIRGQYIRCNRGRLRQWLLHNTDVNWGKRLLNVEETASGVVAVFEDGEKAEGAFLVGADGVNSRVREVIAPTQIANVLPLGIVGGDVDLSPEQYKEQLKLGQSLWLANGPNYCLFGLSYAFFGGESARYYWFFMWRTDDTAFSDYPGSSSSKEEQLAFAKKHTENAHPQFKTLIDTQQAEAMIAPFPIRDIIPQSVQKKRVVLLGDAAHAMTFFRGEGANHAMLDAYKLAAALEKNPNSFGEVVAEYEKEMVERCTTAVKQSHQAALHLGKMPAFPPGSRRPV